MKNISIKLFLVFMVVVGIQISTMAEVTKFTPLNFSDSSSVSVATTSSSTSNTTGKTVSGVEAKGTDLLDPSQVTGGTKMQSAILQIDNAEVEVRNKLLNYKNSYAEIDARYNAAKVERKNAKKQIKQAEKKIKNLDKAKNKIRKNFERKVNI